jgi:hypothetical protein
MTVAVAAAVVAVVVVAVVVVVVVIITCEGGLYGVTGQHEGVICLVQQRVQGQGGDD